MRDIEVQQIAELKTAEPKITQHLSAMDGQNGFKRFQLDNHATVHQHVNSIAILDSEVIISDRNPDLPVNRHSSLCQFVSKAEVAGTFK